MMRPNSIDVKSAAYYQQLQLQQQTQQQQYNRHNGGINYNNVNENIYMPRVLKNYDENPEPISHSSHPRTYNQSDFEQPISPSRIQVGSPSRPSQPPPAPPPETAISPTRGSRGNSAQRESLPPPPPPPPTGLESDFMNGFTHQNGQGGHLPPMQGIGVHQDELPPPPPNPDNNLSARVPVEHLPPSPPPPPAPATTVAPPVTTSAAPPPMAPPPPPPPPPSDKMNGLKITNGDLTNNIKVILSFSREIKTVLNRSVFTKFFRPNILTNFSYRMRNRHRRQKPMATRLPK